SSSTRKSSGEALSLTAQEGGGEGSLGAPSSPSMGGRPEVGVGPPRPPPPGRAPRGGRPPPGPPRPPPPPGPPRPPPGPPRPPRPPPRPPRPPPRSLPCSAPQSGRPRTLPAYSSCSRVCGRAVARSMTQTSVALGVMTLPLADLVGSGALKATLSPSLGSGEGFATCFTWNLTAPEPSSAWISPCLFPGFQAR